MSVKAIVKKYNYSVGGVAVRTREQAREMQRGLRSGAAIDGVVPQQIVQDTKIVQRVLMERIVR